MGVRIRNFGGHYDTFTSQQRHATFWRCHVI
ncbi:hypothetical protein SAMN04487994_10222 [Dolosicoccus paucivorans]|nr:hypothetical protein SAMN04487994_10222 [Dolosicoccus paucivorans]